MKRTSSIICLDLIFILLGYGAVHVLTYGHINVSASNLKILSILLLVWLSISLITKKFTRVSNMPLARGLESLIKSGIFMLFLISLIMVANQLLHLSRTMVYGTIILFVLLEVIALLVYHQATGPSFRSEIKSLNHNERSISNHLLVFDGILLVASFYTIAFFKYGSLLLPNTYDILLILLIGLWLSGSMLTGKFEKTNFTYFLNSVGPALKAVVFMATGLSFFIYMLQIEPVSRLQIFGPLILYLSIELVVFKLYSNYREYKRIKGKIKDPFKTQTTFDSLRDTMPLDPLPAGPVIDPAEEKIKYTLDFLNPNIFEMLKENVNLSKIDRRNCAIMSTDNLFNLNVLDENMRLIVNLHKINDIRWFNQYFLMAHGKLAPGGYLMGKAYTISTRQSYYKEKYPQLLGLLYYVLVFVWKRVFPKLPLLQKLYFAVTQGKGRMVSRTEILGRLCFCGFDIINEQESEHIFYFIAQKANRPCLDRNPTYGPLVRLKRSGLGGQPIIVYKLRTMYPYSEYLQQYVYNLYGTKDGDKILHDFRITGWGRVFRKFWIDELPMLYNWMRGDLKVIGVRPLSGHKLSTYPLPLQEKRKKIKPGLLPPFYAERPNTVEEFFKTEERYLDAYLKKPVSTDFKYFRTITWNIVVLRARSG